MLRSKIQKLIVTAVTIGSLAVVSPALAQDTTTNTNQAWYDKTALFRAESPAGETGHVPLAASIAVGGILAVGGAALGIARYGRREHLAGAHRLAIAAKTALAEWDESSPARAWPLDTPATTHGPVDLSKWNPERGSLITRRPHFPRRTAGSGVDVRAPRGDVEGATA